TLAQFAAHLPNLKASAEEPTTPVTHAHATEISPVIPTERPARAEGPPHLSLRPPQRPHLSPPRHRNRAGRRAATKSAGCRVPKRNATSPAT
ncbi:MAG: hypothetical protein ABR910_17060, partial [Acidobacteriaceae bacterium]